MLKFGIMHFPKITQKEWKFMYFPCRKPCRILVMFVDLTKFLNSKGSHSGVWHFDDVARMMQYFHFLISISISRSHVPFPISFSRIRYHFSRPDSRPLYTWTGFHALDSSLVQFGTLARREQVWDKDFDQFNFGVFWLLLSRANLTWTTQDRAY